MRHRLIGLAVWVCLVTMYSATGRSAGAESAASARRSEKREARQQASRPQLTHADEKYGEHPKQAFDLYLVKSDKPTPLFIWIHGGGFRGGDKRPARAGGCSQVA